MRKALLILLLCASPALAGGPLFRSSDTFTQQEFENIYENIRNPKIQSGAALRLTITTATIQGLTVSTITASSATITSLSVSSLSGSIPSSAISGTSTNDAAAAGKLGEQVSSIATAVAAGGSAVYTDLTSIQLTAGDWDISGMTYWEQNGATWTQARFGISTVSGDDGTGLNLGTTEAIHQNASSGSTPVGYSLVISPYRISLSGTSTYYLKVRASYSAGTPQVRGRINARRPR